MEHNSQETHVNQDTDVQVIIELLNQVPLDPAKDDETDWSALQSEYGFPTPKPSAPELPPQPEEPVISKPPREEDPKYAVELSGLDKFFSSRRIKKQQAALKRFERDRKAWDEDRLNDLAMYEFAKKNHAKQVDEVRRTYADAVDEWRSAFITHLRNAA
jgi:hypothetical protein